MIFVGGIHGVGKTTYCKALELRESKVRYSASELIARGYPQHYEEKKVLDIDINQKVLLNEIKKLEINSQDLIIDGHLCLRNKQGEVERIPRSLFERLGIETLIVLVDAPICIQKKLQSRDKIDWSLDFINHFQMEEIKYAKQLSNEFDFDLRIVSCLSEDKAFGHNILLPVKRIFIEEILCGKKKYEFRKKICVENIDKIYLYATSPDKKVLGEARVLEKIYMDKERLWSYTKTEAGISKEYFMEYFKNSNRASAYVLGEVYRYNEPIKLEDMGISYTPQSYVYL